jgi:hypothetical protein
MKKPEEKSDSGHDAAEHQTVGPSELRQIIEEYANDLRMVILKLRKRLN